MAETNCSLRNVLIEVQKFVTPGDGNFPKKLLENPAASGLLEKLGMSTLYPKRLLLKDALCIRPELLELSLNSTSPRDLEQLPYLVLNKLMAYDIKCRSDLMLQDSSQVTGSEETFSDCYADYGSYGDDDNKSNNNSDGIHPVDIILSLLICSDDILRQDLLSRLAKCQLSVPFILPDPFTKQLTIPLWGLRSIIKDWKCKAGDKIEPKSHSIINYPMPIISFIGFAKQKQGKSKSIILNDVISSSHSPFFHRDCPGGHYDCILGQGMVDMCWYLPAGESTDLFPDAVTFLNLHGDARRHPQQCKFLGQISSMCFVLLTEEVGASDTDTIQILKMFESCPGGITLLDNVGKKPEKILNEVRKIDGIKLADKNADAIKRSISKCIKIKISSTVKNLSIEDCCVNVKKILTDEDSKAYRQSLSLANQVKDLVSSNTGSKDEILPLQGKHLWQTWAENDRELHRQSHRGAKTVNEYTAQITKIKNEVRRKQYDKIETLTPVMKTFLTSLVSLGGSSNALTRSYFLQCLKLQLNNISRERISDFQQQYQDTKKDLDKLQKTESHTSDIEEKIEACKTMLLVLQDNIIDTSVGLEHFFRELGQVYEAAAESCNYKLEELSSLPKAAAELLIDGYPFEVVDGDAAHVPLKWFTAVFSEVVRILNNPKIFVMSVLGLQSTGKSTMLNTAFGLQFNVSAGRCTRGAFIQLLPLDEKLKRSTGCSYILVVDTEGLRAPELDPLKTQKHDNELATFVIGLANMTLINIYGEVPGDMDDILQTSVHAFLRMREVKSHRSCQFVHQNAGSNVKSQVGHSKFTNKLDKFTIDAAREEQCEGEYKTFNDVIKFDHEKDVHHFQGLWKGDPPMAPVNEGYSQSAQKLKQSCIDNMQKQISDKTADYGLSSFHEKVEKLWESLLKENFVFSFKNTLEITAYNSLESEYSKWDWEFRENMLKWEQKLENEVKATTDAEIASLIKSRCDTMITKVIPGFYEPLQSKMDEFFKGKQAEILIQWKTKFDHRLNSLSTELQHHAEKHCKQLRQSKEAIAKIESDQEEYSKNITDKVKIYIKKLKQDQVKLSQNLEEKKRLETCQLKEILDKELFTLEKVKSYTVKKIISQKEANYIHEIIRLSGNKLTEQDIKTIIFGGVLTIAQVKNIIKNGRQTGEQLKSTFDQIWNDLVDQITFTKTERVHVVREVEYVLTHFKEGSEGKLTALLKKKPLENKSALYFVVEEKKHYTCIKKKTFSEFITRIIGGKSVNSHQYHILALEITERVFDAARNYFTKLERENRDSNFNPAFTQKLLHDLDEKIAEESEAIKDCLTFTPEYKLEVYVTACSYAITKFEKMSESFRERHDPRLYLDKNVKPLLYSLFKNQYYQAEAEEAIASTLCAHFEEPIKTQVSGRIGTIMVSRMKSNDKLFSTKMSLKVKILCDLQEADDYTKYMEYILDVKKSILKWIKHYTIKFCDEAVGGGTRLQLASKNEAIRLVGIIENKLNDLDQSGVQQWVKEFCNDSNLKEELGINLQSKDILDGYESLAINLESLHFENFKQKMNTELDKLKKDIQCSYNDIKCEKEMQAWRDKPHDLLESLIGCTEQCPFCGEQCDLQDPNHQPDGPPHSIGIHRSTCLTGRHDVDTKILSTGFCPAYVSGKERHTRFQTSRTKGNFHPYKEYNTVYPEWYIDSDPSSANSLYWKKFIGRYMNRIAKTFDSKPAEVPKEWSDTSEQEVKQNLKDLYKC